jgi:hypothetical protein
MTVEKAVEILNIHQKCRIGEIEEMPYSPKIITEALGLLLVEFPRLSKVKSKKIDKSKCLHDKVFWHNGLGWRCKLCGAQGKVKSTPNIG